MKKNLLRFVSALGLLLCLDLSVMAQEVLPPGIFFGPTSVTVRFNDVCDIFGDNTALYDPEVNCSSCGTVSAIV